MFDMRRRDFITLLGGVAVAWPPVARAQQPDRIPRVGLWIGGAENDRQAQERATAFRDALRQLGWVDGRNLQIEHRWGIFDPEQVRADATGLVALNPDVIVSTGAPALAALARQTRTIPIVFVLVTDPISDGFVASLAHPGGNITGFTIFEHTMAGKWLEMLKEAVPTMTRVAVMQNPDHPAWPAYLRAITTVAPALGVEVTPAPANNASDIEGALATFARTPNGGLILLPSAVATNHRDFIAGLATRHRLPAIYSLRIFPASGGLMSYGVVLAEPYRQAATYVDRILKGAKPSQLPVQAASKFELVINLKTANALGLEVPPMLLVRADEVIE
jgi:putative tryptophan/tyrosine transport system substrate-binding protein